MPIPDYLKDAHDRMKASQKAMVDYIDSQGRDPQVHNTLLLELNESMAAYLKAVQRCLQKQAN